MQMSEHLIYTVDKTLYINYPLNLNEEDIQNLIKDLKNKIQTNNFKDINKIQMDTQDIAISLVFFFKELLDNPEFKETDIDIYFQPRVYDLLIKNFGDTTEAFKSEKIKKVLE